MGPEPVIDLDGTAQRALAGEGGELGRVDGAVTHRAGEPVDPLARVVGADPVSSLEVPLVHTTDEVLAAAHEDQVGAVDGLTEGLVLGQVCERGGQRSHGAERLEEACRGCHVTPFRPSGTNWHDGFAVVPTAFQEQCLWTAPRYTPRSTR